MFLKLYQNAKLLKKVLIGNKSEKEIKRNTAANKLPQCILEQLFRIPGSQSNLLSWQKFTNILELKSNLNTCQKGLKVLVVDATTSGSSVRWWNKIKWKQGKNPWHPHLPANVWTEELTLLFQAERDNDVTSLDTEARPMSFFDSGSMMTSTLSVSLWEGSYPTDCILLPQIPYCIWS